MISSIRMDGSTACMALEGTTDTETFRAYVREVLVPAFTAVPTAAAVCATGAALYRASQVRPPSASVAPEPSASATAK
jgi:hypothetical protein